MMEVVLLIVGAGGAWLVGMLVFGSIAQAIEDASPLRDCEACKKKISKQADACPQCGHPVKQP